MPKINSDASTLEDLIDWSGDDIHEPIFTCNIPNGDLLKFVDNKMTVPKFSVHGQSIERCVQAVTRACASVFGDDRRDGFILATLAHRKLAPSLESKQHVDTLLF